MKKFEESNFEAKMSEVILTILESWFDQSIPFLTDVFPEIKLFLTQKEKFLWVTTRFKQINRMKYIGFSLQRLISHRDTLKYHPVGDQFFLNVLVNIFALYEEFRDQGYPELARITLQLLINYHDKVPFSEARKVPVKVVALIKSRTTPPFL